MPDDEPNKNQMIFIINVCNQSRPVVGYVEHQTDANQIYVAPRLFNVWEVLPIGRLSYFVPRLQRCLPLGVLTDGILNPLLSKNPHRHIFTDCKVLVNARSLQNVKSSVVVLTCRWRITKITRQSAFGISLDNASAIDNH